MPQVKVGGPTPGGLMLEVEEFGDSADPPVLLVVGLNAQLTVWPEDFCRRLADRGHRVVRFDNRDVGLSTWFDHHPVGDPLEAYLAFLDGQPVDAPYSVGDLAADAVGLLDALGLASAHVVGGSFGGMVAQRMAIHWPDRLRSLTSIMSMPRIVPLDLEVVLSLQPPDVDPSDPETDRAEVEAAVVASAVEAARIFAGSAYPPDEDRARRRALEDLDRAWHPDGGVRQMLAVLADGDRRSLLAEVDLPTLVVHGTEDPLVPPQGARETAEAVSGAELVWIEGMGHDWPEAAWPLLLDPICALVARAEAGYRPVRSE